MPASQFIQLNTTDKYINSDNIAGPNYTKYEAVLYYFLTNIADMYPHLAISYPLVFTGSHNLSWLSNTNINKYLALEYMPSIPGTFYIYHELARLYIQKPFQPILSSIICVGLDPGFIEYANYAGMITRKTKITFLGTPKGNTALETFISEKTPALKNITHSGLLTNKTVYDLLLDDLVIPASSKADMVTFNYYTIMQGIDYNFAFMQNISNLVGMLFGLKHLVQGGTLIIHLYAIINKSGADIYLILKDYFETANLYYPECANEYFASGTWAIFTGFKGIKADELIKLLGLLDDMKQLYPAGMSDVNIYDPDTRKKCRVHKAINLDIPHVYPYGYLPEYNDTDMIYSEIREFNKATYKRKYDFTNGVYLLWKRKKNPQTYLLPTVEQSRASIQYLNKWDITYRIKNILGTEPGLADLFKSQPPASNKPRYTYLVKTDYFDAGLIEAEFSKRGNWIPYDSSIHNQLDFFHVDGLHIADRSLFGIKCQLKNLVGDEKKAVTVKSNLYANLIKTPGANTFLPWTLEFDIRGKALGYFQGFRKYFASGKPLICKIVNMGEGQNIIATNKFEEWLAFMKAQHSRLVKNPRLQIGKWVLQEYIDNPYLINKRKFHVRLMLLFQPGDRESYYMHHSRLALAEAPYVRGDWTNKDIHDTHFHRQEGLNWPYDFQLTSAEIAHIYKQYDFICSCIVSSIKPGCYPDSANCFEVFGVDLMFTDKLDVKLIEVNDRIGLSAGDYFKPKLFRAILNLTVDEYFPPLNKQVMPGNFFKISKLTPGKKSTQKRILSKGKKSKKSIKILGHNQTAQNWINNLS